MPLEPTEFNQKIAPAEQILLVYGRNAGFSAVATATSIWLWLRSLGKKATLVSPSSPVVEYSHLVGINKVKTGLTGENMVIKLPLPARSIDKVVSDLNPERDELSLIIKPKRGAGAPKITQLPVAYQAPDYDLIFLLDVRGEEELQPLGNVAETFWRSGDRNIVWHDYANPAAFPTSLDVTLGKDDTYASVWGNFCRLAGLEIDADQASNLLMALERDSDHFGTGKSTADTFELAAWLMRHGGTRYVPDEKAASEFRPENHLPQVISFGQKA